MPPKSASKQKCIVCFSLKRIINYASKNIFSVKCTAGFLRFNAQKQAKMATHTIHIRAERLIMNVPPY